MQGSPEAVARELPEYHERLMRAGFVAQGILYGIVGIIAAAVALGDEKSTADQSGALGSLADSTAGTALLVLLAVGLGAMAAFRLAEVFTGPTEGADGDAEDRLHRAASAVRFVIYGGLCVTAIRLAVNAGGGGSNEDKTTSTVFDLPAGVVLVFAAGAVIAVVGFYQGYRAVSTSFEEELETGRMSPALRRAALVLGVAGHAARAVVFVLIGAFLIKAAVEYDPQEAVGLDGALREIAQQAYGSVLLLLTAVGLFVFGAFCLIEARYRRYQPPGGVSSVSR